MMNSSLTVTRSLLGRRHLLTTLGIVRKSSFSLVLTSRRSDSVEHEHERRQNLQINHRQLQSQIQQRKSFFSRPFSTEPSQCLQYEEFLALVKGGGLQLFDVREPSECQSTGTVPGAINIPIGELGQAFLLSPEQFKEKYQVQMPQKTDTNVAFYCMRGVRSVGALAMVQTVGFQNCRHFAGGWTEWANKQTAK